MTVANILYNGYFLSASFLRPLSSGLACPLPSPNSSPHINLIFISTSPHALHSLPTTLQWNTPMGTSLGLCGWPGNGHDIGGFKGPMPDAELLIRWVQSSVFQPRFCIHSWNDGGTCTEPWSHPTVLPTVRAAIQFRYRLLPYLYALTHEASQTGAPLARPLVYHFPGDPVANAARVAMRDYGDGDDLLGGAADPAGYVRDAASCDYMLGSSVLVAPVYTPGSTSRPVYLPGGSDTLWYEWTTGLWHRGGAVVPHAAAPLESGLPPFFVRDGTLLPLLPEAAVAAEHVRGTAELAGVAPVFHLVIYGARSARAIVIEDDGVSLDTSHCVDVEVTALQRTPAFVSSDADANSLPLLGPITLRGAYSTQVQSATGSAPPAPPYSTVAVVWGAGYAQPPPETGLQVDAQGFLAVPLEPMMAR